MTDTQLIIDCSTGNAITQPFTLPIIDPIIAKSQANAPILSQLAELDNYIPRAIEDYWTAIGFDTTKLPQIQQDRLSKKIALRAQIQK